VTGRRHPSHCSSLQVVRSRCLGGRAGRVLPAARRHPGWVLVCLLLTPAARAEVVPALTEPWPLLQRAAAEVRVGHPELTRPLLDAATPVAALPDVELVASLIRAQAALALGDTSAAATALRRAQHLAGEDPGLQRAVDLLQLRRAAAASDRPATVEVAARLLATSSPPDWLVREARYRRGAARAASVDPAEQGQGTAELQALLARPTEVLFRPEILAQLVRVLGPRAGASYLQQLVLEHGDRAEGRWAATLLPPAELPPELLLRRVRNLLFARDYDALPADLVRLAREPAHRAEALLGQALLRMRLREGYPEALRLLEEVPRTRHDRQQAATALFRQGIVLGHLGRYRDGSRAMQRYLRVAPKGSSAREAGFQRGRLLHEGGHYREAARELRRFAATVPADRATWIWFAGWSLFRAGDYAGALAVFAELVPSRNLLVGPKALYWTARAQLARGERDAARSTLIALLERASAGYYGLLGAALLAAEFSPPTSVPPTSAPGAAPAGSSRLAQALGRLDGLPPLPAFGARPAGYPLAVETFVDLQPLAGLLTRPADQAALRRVRLLALAGLLPLARHEADTAGLARLLLQAGGRSRGEEAVDRLQRALEQWGERWAASAPRRLPWDDRLPWEQPEALQQAYPPAYLQLARAAGAEYGVSEWWLLSHMLQESRYRAQARSYVGALGPMQVMPRTGRRIAAHIGFPAGEFTDDALYDPGVGLRHAAWYLAQLRHEYQGWLVLAMAAYNGGPLLVGQHLGTRTSLPGDVLIEEIGAHESRNYARKVTDHLVRYLALYATDAERDALLGQLLPPPTLAPPRQAIRF